MSERIGPAFQTYTGVKYYPYDPRPEEVMIEDIAHALANICRFNGHTKQFYSVAQHSVLAADNIRPPGYLWFPGGVLQEWALLHDAAEAYVGDISRPVRGGPAGPEFKKLHDLNLTVIAQRFGLQLPVTEPIQWAVTNVDLRLLATEARDVMGGQAFPWDLGECGPLKDEIEPWNSTVAKLRFCEQFDILWDDWEHTDTWPIGVGPCESEENDAR